MSVRSDTSDLIGVSIKRKGVRNDVMVLVGEETLRLGVEGPELDRTSAQYRQLRFSGQDR